MSVARRPQHTWRPRGSPLLYHVLYRFSCLVVATLAVAMPHIANRVYASTAVPHFVQKAAPDFTSAPQLEQCTFSFCSGSREVPHCIQYLSPGSLGAWHLGQITGAGA